MPRITNTNHRIQCAFVPLVFRTHFQPEWLLTTPLPWNISYPPHGDGKPADDTPPAMDQGPSANKVPLTKIRRPLGEPGRKGDCSFSTKDVLNLSEEMYEDLLVGLCSISFQLYLIHLIGRSSHPCCETFGCCKNNFKSVTG